MANQSIDMEISGSESLSISGAESTTITYSICIRPGTQHFSFSSTGSNTRSNRNIMYFKL